MCGIAGLWRRSGADPADHMASAIARTALLSDVSEGDASGLGPATTAPAITNVRSFVISGSVIRSSPRGRTSSR